MSPRRFPPLAVPAFSLRAWVRFLRSEGCTITEVAKALNVTEIEVARLAGGHCPSPPDSADEDLSGVMP